MQKTDLRSFLGHRCQLMVECLACGGTHVHEGMLAAAREPGELQIDGRSYPFNQVRALISAPATEIDPAPAMIARPALDVAVIAGVALAALTVLRLWIA